MGLSRQTDDHRRRVARVADFVVHEEMMLQGRVRPADCCSGPLKMLMRFAGRRGATVGDAGAGPGQLPFPMGRRWDGFRRGTCSPPRLAVSSLTDSPPAFQPNS